MLTILNRVRHFTRLAFSACAFFMAASANAADPPAWMLTASPSEVNGILARHNFAMRDMIRPGLYKVAISPTMTSAQLMREIAADAKIQGFEFDNRVDSPEMKRSSVMSPSLSALNAALSDRTTVTYFGARVRGSYVNQTAVSIVELSGALSRFGAGRATVAVIDTGIDPNHPALKSSLLPGYDFTRNIAGSASEMADLNQSTVAILDQSTVAILDSKNFPLVLNQSTVAILDQSTVAILDSIKVPSDFGHGTMVAGLIHLVAPEARILPLKAFRGDGSSNLSDIIRAIYYAVDHQAKVINMSFSTTAPSNELAAAIAYARARSVICVSSAGNEGKEMVVYPAGYVGVIGVGSVSFADLRSAFSNYGVRSVRTSAPGEGLITTYPGNNYAGVWGTSFSTALVSGAAALIAQVRPEIAVPDFADAIDHGKRIEQKMGDARLDVLLSTFYALLNW